MKAFVSTRIEKPDWTSLRQALGWLSRVDRLVALYLAALAIVTVLRVPSPKSALIGMGFLFALLVLLARTSRQSRLAAVAHDFAPIAYVVGLFNLSAPAIAAVSPFRGDALFAGLDARLFGALAGLWRNALGRPVWLTEVASVAYASFYVLPVVVAIHLYRRRSRADFEDFVFGVVATFIASYVGYFLLPTAGPRVAPGVAGAVLGGGRAREALFALLHVVERNQLDAFPSGHTAVSLVTLSLGSRLVPSWRVPLAAVVAGIIFSTVYLSFHYVIDLVAGAGLAVAMLVALARTSALRRRSPPPQRRDEP